MKASGQALTAVILSKPNTGTITFLVPTKRAARPFSTSTTSFVSNDISAEQQQLLQEKKAGEEGYSILRQSRNWDATVDPRFDTPKSLGPVQTGFQKTVKT